MEVDWSAVDEGKESSDGAAIPPSESSVGSSEDFPMQTNEGAPRVSVGLSPRMDSAGKPACEICGRRLASATHPCPICVISFNSFINTSRYRQPGDQHSIDRAHTPLLTIPADRIVPTPLHLFLGISNRIILDAFSELFSKELVQETLERVKTIHSAGCGGKSDIFQLNGPEVCKWIKQDCNITLRTSAEQKGSLTADQKSTFTTLTRWLENLHDHLLHKKEWTMEQIEDWSAAVDDIQQNWSKETGQAAFPKLHMLRHSLEFAERYRFLGRASEAQIESYHYQFKKLFNEQHLNMAHDEPERIRRCLVDTTLRVVQPILQGGQYSYFLSSKVL